ncbi:MaoC/PaaZ C-terminal domain-containing protein [Streptomyces sp. DSM 42041]|uniref:MaoC/PaaZ C-terminal domain-containing protein n=1 Tax=Streptomyces hazeniae TaxID=3075538 RepID=A0ABU2NWV7_9ACTN|nr:MaoC/PaaZ C-terminal domain-containing protein [Streptomyces sp. DSM 42041]MDT0380693.1 MaoC/PaaZ C-terminal domain-containing protein [Streptomyces sp. DSM 42041]
MALTTTLLRGALGSLRKRPPYEGAALPARVLTAPSVRIDARHVAAYAEVCGFPPTGGTGPLPPTYPHLLGFPLAMRLLAGADFPFPLLGLVHTGIEVAQRRALRPGDRPEIRVHTEGLAPHRRGTAFHVVTSAWLDGAEVWSSRSTYLCRHRRPDAAPETGGADGAVRTNRTDTATRTDGAGDAAPLPVRAEWRLPGDLGRRYGAVSGDRNPIHLHPLTARAFGFPRAIAHGMWTFARCLAETSGTAVGTGAGTGTGTGTGTSDPERLTAHARFAAPVLLPGEVVLLAGDGAEGAFALRDSRDRARLHVSGKVSSGPPS